MVRQRSSEVKTSQMLEPIKTCHGMPTKGRAKGQRGRETTEIRGDELAQTERDDGKQVFRTIGVKTQRGRAPTRTLIRMAPGAGIYRYTF